MALTTDYLTGFEPGVLNTSGGNTDVAKAVTGAFANATIISSGQRTGNYAVQVAPTGAAAGNVRWFNVQTGSTRRAWRFAVKITVLPSSGSTIIFAAHLSTTWRVGVRVDSTGLIQASLDGTNWVGSTTLTNPTTAWQIIDVNLDYSSATNALNWRVNEVTQTGTTFGAATTAPSVWTLGTIATTGAAATMLYDDVITGLATSATDFYGNGEVLGLVAGSDGSHSFTANDFSTGDAGTQRAQSYTSFYDEVNDLPWTTARNTTRNIAQRVIRTTGYTVIAPVAADSSKPTANAVLARLSWSSPTTQANTAGCVILNSASASATIYGASGALADYSETSNFTRGAFPTTPGAGWTHTEISALRFRFGYAGDITPVPTAQSLMLEVDYPIVAGAGDDWTESVDDTATITDEQAKRVTKGVADTATVTDSITRVAAFVRSIADTATVTDAITKKAVQKGLDDTASVTDAVAKRATKGIDDTASITDAISVVPRVPASVVIDDFNRTDESPLSQSGNWAGPWIPGVGAMKLLSNVAGINSGSEGDAYRTDIATTSTDQEVIATVGTMPSSGEMALLWRINPTSDNGYMAAFTPTGTSFNLWKITAGSYSAGPSGISFGATVVAGDKFAVRSIGSSHEIWLWRAATNIWTLRTTWSEATHAAGTIGIYVSGTTARWDDFGGRALAVGGAAHDRDVDDTIAVTDALTKLVRKGLADTGTVTDAITRKAVAKALADTGTVTDAISKRVQKGLADTASVTDATSKRVTKGLADTATVTDAVGKRLTKTIADGISVTDSINVDLSGALPPIETALEVDTALPFTRQKVRAIGTATDTEIGRAFGRQKLRPITLATETDTTFALTRQKRGSISQAQEVDTAQPLGKSKADLIGPAVETDVALPFTRRKIRSIGTAVEVDTALPVTAPGEIVITIGTAAETDTALPFTRRKVRAIGTATEVDTALPLARRKTRLLGLATETDLALPFTAPGEISYLIGVAVEADTALAFTRVKRRSIGTATEVDTGIHLGLAKSRTLGTAVESDTAFALNRRKTRAIGLATEIDVALALVRARARTIGVALEVDSTFGFTRSKRGLLGLATEIDTALPFSSPARIGFIERVDPGARASEGVGSVSPVMDNRRELVGAGSRSGTEPGRRGE